MSPEKIGHIENAVSRRMFMKGSLQNTAAITLAAIPTRHEASTIDEPSFVDLCKTIGAAVGGFAGLIAYEKTFFKVDSANIITNRSPVLGCLIFLQGVMLSAILGGKIGYDAGERIALSLKRSNK